MQTDLKQHISEFTLALTGNPQDDEYGVIPKITASSRISPQLALEIYRNNTRGARINALELIYPACKSILGDDTFRSIAREFVITDTIGTSDLNQYGETFNHYLGVILDTGRLPDEYAYLQNLASLEFKYHAAYYADSDPDFDFELFERKIKSGQQLYLRLSSSVGLLSSLFPLYEIWLQNRPALATKRNKSQIRHDVQTITDRQYLLVFRHNSMPVVVSISEYEYRLLDAFNNNHSLQSVVDRIDCDIDVLLPRLIEKKWVVGMT
jgi:hypothetical protein